MRGKKIIAIALVIGITGGMIAGCAQNQETEVSSEIITEIQPAEVVDAESTEDEILVEEEVDTVQVVQDDDYPSLISGNLTKEEFEFVLSEGLEYYATDGIEESEYVMILNLLFAEGRNDEFIEVRDDRVSIDNLNMNAYSLTDVNRLISCFTDFQYSEDNDNDDTGNGVYVVGDNISIAEASKAQIVDSATITSAEYTSEEMIIYYTYENVTTDDDDIQYQTIREKKAVLEPTEEGLYRIVSIINVGDEALEDYEEVLNAYATIFYSSDSIGEGETIAALDIFSQYGCEINETGTIGDSGIFSPFSSSTTFKSGGTIDSIYAACMDINSDGISECIIALQDVGSNINDKQYVDIWTLENGNPKWLISSKYSDIITLCEDGIFQEIVAGGASGSDYYYYQLQDTTIILIDSGLYDGNIEMLEEKYPFADYEFSWNEIKNPEE